MPFVASFWPIVIRTRAGRYWKMSIWAVKFSMAHISATHPIFSLISVLATGHRGRHHWAPSRPGSSSPTGESGAATIALLTRRIRRESSSQIAPLQTSAPVFSILRLQFLAYSTSVRRELWMDTPSSLLLETRSGINRKKFHSLLFRGATGELDLAREESRQSFPPSARFPLEFIVSRNTVIRTVFQQRIDPRGRERRRIMSMTISPFFRSPPLPQR